MRSAEDCLKAAFAALLRGDTAERDRQCRLAENIMRAGDRVAEGGPAIVGSPIIVLPDRSKEELP